MATEKEQSTCKSKHHCCVPMCTSNRTQNNENTKRSFHTFPKPNDSQRRKEWLIRIRRDEGPDFKITQHTVVCSLHFLSTDFVWTPLRRKLKPDAVPSVFAWKQAPTCKQPAKHPVLSPVKRTKKMETPAEDGTRSLRGPALYYQIQGIYYLPPCTPFPLLKRDQEIVAHHMNEGYGFPSAHFDYAVNKFRKLSIPLATSESAFRSLVAGMYPKLTASFYLCTVSKDRELEIIPPGVSTLAWLKAQATRGYQGVVVIKDAEEGGQLVDSVAKCETVLHDPQHVLVGEASLPTGPGDYHFERDNKAAANLSASHLVMRNMTSEQDAIKSENSTFETSLTVKPETSFIAVPSETKLTVESETSLVVTSKTGSAVTSQTESGYVPRTRLAMPWIQTSGRTLLTSREGWPKKKCSLEISSEIYDRWAVIGIKEGMTTDSDIASFFVKMYERVSGAPHLNVTCPNCNSPLQYVCTKCCSNDHKFRQLLQTTSRTTDNSDNFYEQHHEPQDSTFSHPQCVNSLVHADTGSANSTDGCMHKRVKSGNVNASATELSPSTVHICRSPSEEDNGSQDTANDYVLDTDTEAVSSESTAPSAENTEEEPGPPNSQNRKRKSDSQCSKSKHETSVAKQKKMFGPRCKPGPQKELERFPKQPRPARHVCERCGRSFISPSTLEEHMLLHTGEKPHACQICNASFRVKRQLKLHKQARHSGQRAFLCPFCGNAYSREGTLKVHLRKHTDKKSFICNFCNASFMIKSQLEIHNRIHTDLRPFPCTVCGFAFREKSKLKQHMMTHTGEKPFECSQCSATFRRKKNLILHKRRHNHEKPFHCEVCSYTCVDAPILKVHSRVHTGEKNYVCSVCDTAFAYNRALKNHMQRHNHQTSVTRDQEIGK